MKGNGATPLHRRIFGDGSLDGAQYKRFFDARVTRLEGEGIGFASCHGAFACSTASGTVRLSDHYVEPEIPAVVRLSFLVHEARHAEGWGHETCPAGTPRSPFQNASLAGARECDPTELGANGVQIVMLKNIARYCTTCADELRHEADTFADFLLQLITSESARKILAADFSN
jgi:hypothetical protein